MLRKNSQNRRTNMAKSRRGFIEGHDEGIGKGEHANMPKETIMESYPKSRMGRDNMIDDSMSDIDDVQDAAISKRDRNMSNQK